MGLKKIKIKKIKKLEGKIILKTGLHIGAGNDEIKIGGIDNPVVKNPLTSEPYIPGSSLKGKVRTLLEWYEGEYNKEGGPSYSDGDGTKITKLFGNGKNEKGYTGGPTRVSFSDCFLTKESARELREKGALTESKYEVSIDRRSGTASKAGPRQTERVPAGAEFNFTISVRIFDGDDENEFIEFLLKGLKLLTYDALGGNGSRGYGRVEFEFFDNDIEEKFKNIPL